jgi:hypothetical protein
MEDLLREVLHWGEPTIPSERASWEDLWARIKKEVDNEGV